MTDVVRVREQRTACNRRIGIATLNAPASLNALSLAMVDALQACLTRWAADPGMVAVVLDGEGDKAFCAGGDLRDRTRASATAAARPTPMRSNSSRGSTVSTT